MHQCLQKNNITLHNYVPNLVLAEDMSYDDVTKKVDGEDPAFPKVRLVSPIEMNIAFVGAAWRDRNDPSLLEEWKRPGMETCAIPKRTSLLGSYVPVEVSLEDNPLSFRNKISTVFLLS